jgi:two-component system sensor histidine kinase QseC
LRELHDELAARQAQSLRPLSVPAQPVPAEIVPLRQTLDALFARMASLLESERRFTADAAHELRTPIAAIRTQAQVALGATDDAERRHALQATLSGCDRAAHLVQQLLTLSRLEASVDAGALPVDLAVLAQRQAAELALVALDRQQTLTLDVAGSARVSGDEVLLGVLLRNLLDNALRYSPPGASVAVRVQGDVQQVCLSVEDSGPGLSQAELARLGERFFRVLGSGAQGSGLGWSIVRRIASVHHAEVQATRSATLGGLCVVVVFAAAAQGVA